MDANNGLQLQHLENCTETVFTCSTQSLSIFPDAVLFLSGHGVPFSVIENGVRYRRQRLHPQEKCSNQGIRTFFVPLLCYWIGAAIAAVGRDPSRAGPAGDGY